MKKSVIAASCLLIASCKPLPPPNGANLSMPKKTRSGVYIVDQPTFGHALWWEKMHDPVLTHLIREALVVNNQLGTAKANVAQAEAQLKSARLAWLPTLSLKGASFVGGGWDSSFTPHGLLGQSVALNKLGNIHFHGYYSGFVPDYSVNILANMSQTKLANASRDIQIATYLSTRISIISQVSGSYFMLLGQKQQLKDQAKLLHDLKTLRQLEWARYQRGASDLSKVISLDEQISQNQATQRSNENSIAQTENALQVLLNRNPGPIATKKLISDLSIRDLIPANVPSIVLRNRPDIIIAQQNLKMTEANLGLAYSNFFPAISLTGLLGGASVELSHLLSLSTGLWIAEAAASIPILNGSNYQQIKAAKAGYYAAYYTYLQTLRSVFADVDNSLTHQQKLNQAYQDQLNAYQASNKTLNLVLARYRAGAIDYRDIVNAQIGVDNAKLQLTLAKMQQLDGVVEVYQALAGGDCEIPIL
jgi:multidrug efflux system outer membrane protein